MIQVCHKLPGFNRIGKWDIFFYRKIFVNLFVNFYDFYTNE